MPKNKDKSLKSKPNVQKPEELETKPMEMSTQSKDGSEARLPSKKLKKEKKLIEEKIDCNECDEEFDDKNDDKVMAKKKRKQNDKKKKNENNLPKEEAITCDQMMTTFDLGNDVNATLTQDKQSSGQYVLNINKSHNDSESQTVETVVSLRSHQWNRLKQVFHQIDQIINSSQ
jgi:hypothetical protein